MKLMCNLKIKIHKTESTNSTNKYNTVHDIIKQFKSIWRCAICTDIEKTDTVIAIGRSFIAILMEHAYVISYTV